MRMPDFLGIGAAKAGTTSISNYLMEHPEVFVAKGEPRFFSFEGMELDPNNPVLRETVTDLESYQALFKEVTNEKAIGEISPSYLLNPRAPERIKYHLPNVKLFAVLRDPADRAYSHYLHMIKTGYEHEYDFSLAMQEEKVIIGDWNRTRVYIPAGFYYKLLSRYYELFDSSQIKVMLYEDLRKNSVALMQDLYRFLGVDDSFTPDVSVMHNPSGVPKSRSFQTLISKSYKLKGMLEAFLPDKIMRQLVRFKVEMQRRNLDQPSLSPELRETLIGIYRDDILRLQDLIDRDLSSWLRVNKQ